MGKSRRIDDIRRSPRSPYIKGNEEMMQGMRWLYESDAEFERAKKKLAAELSREDLKKELAKKARIKKAKIAATKLTGTAKRSLAVARKAVRTALSPTHRRKTFTLSSTVAVVLVLVYSFVLRDNPNPQVLGEDLPSEPTYNTLVPNDEIENTTSGRIAYDRQRQVTSYTDEIGGIGTTISQQPMPDRFKDNPFAELAKLAKEIHATEKLETGTTTAYMSRFTDGTQTVVFIKSEVLVFINANEELDVVALFGYIDSLQ